MTSKSPNRQTRKRKSNRVQPKSLEELAQSELDPVPSDPNARDEQLASLRKQLFAEVKEVLTIQNEAENERLQIVARALGNAPEEKPDKPLPLPVLWTIIIALLVAFAFCIIATINPYSFFPSEVQIMASKGISNTPGAIIGFLIGKYATGKRD